MVRNNKEQRSFALLLYEIMLKLTLFYACCQEKDVNEAGIKTAGILKLMVGQLNSWKDKIDFSDQERGILKRMFELVEKELGKTTEETPHKENYISFLIQLAECLAKLIG